MADALHVTLLVTTDRAAPGFEHTAASAGPYPAVLAADNLRTAQQLAARLDPDAEGNAALPLLHVHAPAPRRPRTGLHPSAFVFAQNPRQIAGLIADSTRVGVARGAVVTLPDDVATRLQLRHDIAAHLEQAGFTVSFEVPGWTLSADNLTVAS